MWMGWDRKKVRSYVTESTQDHHETNQYHNIEMKVLKSYVLVHKGAGYKGYDVGTVNYMYFESLTIFAKFQENPWNLKL